MTEAERERGFDNGESRVHEMSGSDAAAEPVPSTPTVELIFLHSSWRTSSTWFWAKFRPLLETVCYYEPFNEDLSTITPDQAASAGYDSWDSRHPPGEPYYLQYLPLIQTAGGVRLFDRPMSLDWFTPVGGLRGTLRDAEVKYLNLLIDHARETGRIPVFGDTRSLGRLWAIKNSFGGLHVFLHRNLWKQWLSYLYYTRRGMRYFGETTARVIAGSEDHFLAAIADFYAKRALGFRLCRGGEENQTPSDNERLRLLHSLPESHAFAMFMALHVYLYLHAQLAADLTIDVTKLARDSEYRSRIENQLAQQTGLQVSLSDVTDRQPATPVAIGAAAIDWDEIRQHACACVEALGVYADSTDLMQGATALIDSAIEEMHYSEAELAKRSDAAEEIWWARLQEARCHWALGDSEGFMRQALALHEERPDRAEPLFDLARFHRERGMHQTAADYAEAGLALERPPNHAEFVDHLIYQSGLQEELSIAGFYCSDPGRKDRGFAACNWLALNRDIPEDTRNLARGHLRFYVEPASKLMRSFTARPVGFTPPEGWHVTSPSIARRGDEIVMMQGTVNYVPEDGNYRAPIGESLATRNFLLRLNSALDLESSVEILPPADLPAPAYEKVGFEDMRLFAWRSALWCSSSPRELTPEGRCQQVLARIDESVGGQCQLADWRVLALEEPRRHENSWMPLVEPAPAETGGERLRFIYLYDPLRLIDEAAQVLAETTPPIAVDEFRGGTQAIDFDGGRLALIREEMAGDTFAERATHHRFVWLDEALALRSVSRPFFLNEHGVEFVAGLAWHPNGERLIISYGVGDGESWIATVDVAEVRAALEDAERLPSGAWPRTVSNAVTVPALLALETELRTPKSENLPAPNLGSFGVEDFVSQHSLRPARDLRSRLDAHRRVLIAILAKQKEKALPLFLRCIEGLDYPKSSIVLYVRTNNNTDRTEEILRDWIARVGPSYGGVELDAAPVEEPVEKFGQHEWNATRFRVLGYIRNTSLLKTKEHFCDFYFVCDVDNFIRPCTLRELVALNLPIVGPFLRVTNPCSYHTNFFAEVDPNGFYVDCDQYRWITHRRVRGVFEVPVVHCTYLIRSDVVPQLRYLDGSDRHEFLILSESARKAGIQQYIDNRQIYGYMTYDAESDAAKVTIGEARHNQIAMADSELSRVAGWEPSCAEVQATREDAKLPPGAPAQVESLGAGPSVSLTPSAWNAVAGGQSPIAVLSGDADRGQREAVFADRNCAGDDSECDFARERARGDGADRLVAPAQRVFTIQGTVLFVDVKSGELRHGPVGTSPVNVRFEPEGGRGWIAHEVSGTLRTVTCLPYCSHAISEASVNPAAATIFEIVPLDHGWVGLKAGEVFLSAEPDGRIALSRAECRVEESFELSAFPHAAETFGALGLLTPYDVSPFVKRRVGRMCDGGYVLLDDFDSVSAVYSVGIGGDISFDTEFAEMGKPVFMFDHTIDKPPMSHVNFHFFREGIAAQNDPSRAVYRLDRLIEKLGHDGRSDLLLKIDIEGAEFDVFAKMLRGTLQQFRQITMEVHALLKLSEPEYRAKFIAALARINSVFTLFHVHANNFSDIGFVQGFTVADILELSFVRTDLVVRTPSETVYPTAHDFPNWPRRPDHLLWFYPFAPASSGMSSSRGARFAESLKIANRSLTGSQEPSCAEVRAPQEDAEPSPPRDASDAAARATRPLSSTASSGLPIHVISLDRTPARLAEFQRRNAHLSHVERFRAIDGRTLDREKLIKDGVITADCIYTAGNVGCAMSHFALWRKAVEEDRPITVAEDDAIFSRNFAGRSREFLEGLPEDWDFVQWGWVFQQRVWVQAIPQILNTTMIFDQDQLRRHIEDFQSSDVTPTPVRLRHSFGTVCYSVSPKGARALLEHCTPLSGKLIEFPGFGVVIENKGIDCMMNGVYPSLKAFISVPPLAVTEHREEETTTREGGVDRFHFSPPQAEHQRTERVDGS
jgi:GR25 family glycosyltransferase involved in LPS biosynthesis